MTHPVILDRAEAEAIQELLSTMSQKPPVLAFLGGRIKDYLQALKKQKEPQ
jgi:hypothetical protein